MPELPEVETIRIGLQRLLPGRVVAAVEHDNAKSFPNAPADVAEFLVGASVVAVKRRAKVLLMELSSKYSLVIHLKMTGQLVFVGYSAPASMSFPRMRESSNNDVAKSRSKLEWIPDQARNDTAAASEIRFGAGHPNDSLIGHLPDKSTRVTFTFEDGSHLFFNDQRKFGWMRLLPTTEVPNIDFMKKVGPEPLDERFTAEEFTERFQRRKNTSIKAALLDQTVVAGIGNIYADESLWGAKIHPQTLVKNLREADFSRLFTEVQYVLNLSIEKGGSSDKNYINAEGKRGSYLSFARVFRREGQPCPRCGHSIEKTRVAGRGTHLCPFEQKIVR
ncbi:MAG TPA: bifunctional DNA-formamidopyrimidine glycosylase/DNA-(apurinic or apyrimidinic site) lyase [Candidatus Saccharimonadales bacterium]|nr:bifunctional DNA-formamidopyrimidine glycosylase/DNA-(apurinic or apyrimidinic site) lyase [Candidatus Saccharimonadales bacterium]